MLIMFFQCQHIQNTSVNLVDDNVHVKTVSFSAEDINGRCPSAPTVFIVFPCKQFHFIVDTSANKLTDSVFQEWFGQTQTYNQ
jgi:hypothetical protein